MSRDKTTLNFMHQNQITTEIWDFLDFVLEGTLSNYVDQLSLNLDPHIISIYKNHELIGAFLGERIPQITEIFELKLVVLKKNVVWDNEFWMFFRKSCQKEGFKVVVCFYLDPTICINLTFKELTTNFDCADIVRIGISSKEYTEIEKFLGKTELDYLRFGQSFTIDKKDNSRNFKADKVTNVSDDEFQRLFESHKRIATNRIIKQIILYFPEYQKTILEQTLSGKFGKIDNDVSMAIRCENNLVGYILVAISDQKEAFILESNVHPDYQGLGLGAILIRNVGIKSFEKKKCILVKGLIEYSHFMRAFYEKWGSKVLKKGIEGIWIL